MQSLPTVVFSCFFVSAPLRFASFRDARVSNGMTWADVGKYYF